MNTEKPGYPVIDNIRFRKVRRFFAKLILHAFFWDVFLNRPIFRIFRTSPIERWRQKARQYRSIAVEMGGVLIKLGQFLSARVDILPAEVIGELAGLQDKVPPEPFNEVARQIQEDFKQPASEVFAWLSPDPMGSASLAQVHPARIKTGEKVVVKVLRPGIEVLVETDLKALKFAFKWLKYYKKLSKRVDLDWLFEEFSSVTRKELDFELERRNAERLASDFSDEESVFFPRVFPEYSTARTLTMEKVDYIKIGDIASIDAAGIDRRKVAETLFELYMRQVFENHFVHVDPHPGNLFVKPLPNEEELEQGIVDYSPEDVVPYKFNRPFEIVFVDFGMAVTVPERLRTALKQYAIGFGTHDSYMIIRALTNAGMLLEGADLKRLEEAQEAILQRIWGIHVGKMRDVAMKEAETFFRDYRDVIFDMPVQFQADTIFILRAVGILSGIAANLDPDFNVWIKTIPFAKKYAREELKRKWRGIRDETEMTGQRMVQIPGRIAQILTQLERGTLTTRNAMAADTRKEVRNLIDAVYRLSSMTAGAGLLVSGSLFVTFAAGKIGWLFIFAGILFLIRGGKKN